MEDKDRTFLKIPLDKSQESCVQLENMLLELDNYNTKNTNKIFKNFAASKNIDASKASKLFTYQPAVRTPQADDDDIQEVTDGKSSTNNSKPKTERFKYCKMQFNTDYPEKNITSQIFIRTEGPEPKITAVKPKTPSDLEELGLVWGSKVRMIVMVNKLWAAKAKHQVTQTRSYGITMKIMQMEIIPRERSSSIKDQFAKYAFIDGEESEDTQVASGSTATESATAGTKGKSAQVVAATVDEDESSSEANEPAGKVESEEEEEVEEAGGNNDDEDDNEEEEEEEEEEAPKAKPTKKTATTANAKKGGKAKTSTTRR